MKHLFLFLMLGMSIIACKKDKECPPRYTGSDCNIQIKPTRVRVTKVELTNYPATYLGQNWDVSSQWADPYFQIHTSNGVVFESEYLNEKQPATISQWDVDIVLTPDDAYGIRFLDEDGNTDEYIDGWGFVPYDNRRDFPDKLTISGENYSQITVWLTYEY